MVTKTRLDPARAKRYILAGQSMHNMIIEGNLDLSGEIFEKDIYLFDVTIKGDLDLRDAIILGSLQLQRATIKGDMNLATKSGPTKIIVSPAMAEQVRQLAPPHVHIEVQAE